MARNIMLLRDEAELLTDLLMLTDKGIGYDLSAEIRELFGMVSQESELIGRGITLESFRKEWARKLSECDDGK